ncbi:MAG TPA: chemotaxis protein MotB [Nitrospiraceae bacterium]|nr:chemotaxis protein MotB [Nitrospiraceae bacterium]
MKNGIVLSLSIALLLLSGCVSAAKYDLKVNEAKELTAKKTDLEAQIQGLTEERDTLKKERDDFQGKVDELSPQAEKAEKLEKASQTYEDLIGKLEKEIKEGEVQITEMKNRLTMTMVDKVLFASGRAKIGKRGQAVLDKVVSILKDVKGKRIQVEGHTDSVRITKKLQKKFPTNWELSTARASEVVRYLQEHGGINPRLLSSTGYSQYQPVASNKTAKGRRRNRRIEIVLLPLVK